MVSSHPSRRHRLTWPLIESVARLPLTSQPVELHIGKVMCQGMVPVTIEAKATVKLAGREADGMDEAIERFLGKAADAVSKTAKQALDGALRGVAATMTPEQANSSRLELAKAASERPRHPSSSVPPTAVVAPDTVPRRL